MAGRRSHSIKVSYLSEAKQDLGGLHDVFDVLINATPLRDARGVVCGAIGIAQDMSTSRCVDVDLERARVTQVCYALHSLVPFLVIAAFTLLLLVMKFRLCDHTENLGISMLAQGISMLAMSSFTAHV